MSDLPTGTMTFLFTDVEGSTSLWEQHPAAMERALARHDALMDELLPRYGGRQVKERGEGDSIFAVFSSPSAALAAVCALQQALLAEPWPAGAPLRVRMALHSGEAALRQGSYYGTTVNRCARIRGLAHGGQTLLSQATHDLVRDALPEGVSLRDLGSYRLRGLERPEAVYQLCHPALPGEFPPLVAPQAPRHNLPEPLSSFIGREVERGEVLGLLGAQRLVTLVGTGGVGKTRLALAVAGESVDAYPDGAWLVELAGLREGALVAGAVAQTLGLREEPGRPLPATLIDHLRARWLLLVLDNCEHLLDACAELAGRLLAACPRLRILATSREALGVAGEHHYRVPSLAVPDPAGLSPLDELGQVEAVALFLDRARARRAEFALTAQNAAALVRICARLEGIPLAIELAAGRVGGMPLEAIAARLDQGIRLLTGGPRTVPTRQQTLQAALDWSWDLLGQAERVLLRRLSVFAGGWTLQAAEAVLGAGEGLERWEVGDLLASLVGKSLVVLEEREGEQGRYRLLEPVRQYSQERLAGTGEAEAVRARHLAWCLALAEEAEPRLSGSEQGRWLDRLEAEHDNLRAALAWSLGAGAAVQGLQLAAALWRFWEVHGHLSEGRRWLGEALAHCQGDAVPADLSARARNAAGNLAEGQGDYAGAWVLHQESLALRRELGDTPGIAGSLNNLGIVAWRQGDYARAQQLQEESLALFRELGDRWGVASSLNNLGYVAERQGDYGRARALHEQSLALRSELGDRGGIAASLGSLGLVAERQGDYERARALHQESLALFRELGDREGIAESLGNLGHVAEGQGDYAGARALQEESLALFRELGDRWGIKGSLERLARLAGAQGQPRRGAQLWGAADALRRELGSPRTPSEQAEYEQSLATLRDALGEAAYAAARQAGEGLSPDEAVALALATDQAPAQRPAHADLEGGVC